MSDAYTRLASISAAFYDLYNDSEAIADFIIGKLQPFKVRSLCFVGGFFLVVRALARRGFNVSVVDYTDEMVAEGRKRLPGIPVIRADLRALPFQGQFDAVIVIGRVFTHFLSDEEFQMAIESCSRALRPGGALLFDNYEDSKIGKTPYFNSRLSVSDGKTAIERTSSIEAVSSAPLIVKWKASYTFHQDGRSSNYSDEILHRAFSRTEVQELLSGSPFRILAQGDNFDETSFFTLAQKR